MTLSGDVDSLRASERTPVVVVYLLKSNRPFVSLLWCFTRALLKPLIANPERRPALKLSPVRGWCCTFFFFWPCKLSAYVPEMVLQISACLAVISWLLYVSSGKGGPGFPAKYLSQHSFLVKESTSFTRLLQDGRRRVIHLPWAVSLFPSAACNCHVRGMQTVEGSVVSPLCGLPTTKCFFLVWTQYPKKKKPFSVWQFVCSLASLQNSVLKSQFGLKLQSVEDSKVNRLLPHSTAAGHVVAFKM